ncbi:MAG: ADP-ribosylglycohydrolase family protein [Pirellulaceae bacterium]
MEKIPFAERMQGCIAGQSIADGIAFLLHGHSLETIVEWADSEVLSWLSGQEIPDALYISDGTQLSWDLLGLFHETGTFEPHAFANRLAWRVSKNRLMGRYAETHFAAKNLRNPRDWRVAGVQSLGSGGVHRAPVIGTLFHDRPADLMKASQEQSMITHKSPLAMATSMLVSDLVAKICNGEVGPDAEVLPIAIPHHSPELESVMAHIPSLLGLEPSAARTQVVQMVDADTQGSVLPDHVIASVMWCFYCVLTSRWDYARSLQLALKGGGNDCTSGLGWGDVRSSRKACVAFLETFFERSQTKALSAPIEFWRS